jgi:hypothetical protein
MRWQSKDRLKDITGSFQPLDKIGVLLSPEANTIKVTNNENASRRFEHIVHLTILVSHSARKCVTKNGVQYLTALAKDPLNIVLIPNLN